MPDNYVDSNTDGRRQQRNTGSRIERKPALSLNALAKEDVEADPIELTEVSSFVNVSFEADLSIALSRDNVLIGLHERTNPEVNRKGARIVWVEHAKTGELVPVVLRGGVAIAEDINDKGVEDSKKETDDANTPLLLPPSLSGRYQEGDIEGGHAFSAQNVSSTHAYADGITLLRYAFLFVQGLLAGFSFTTISSQTAIVSDSDFIISYQPNAIEYRRLFYLFCSISVVGSIDTLLTLISKVVHRQGKNDDVDDNESGFMAPLCKALTVQGDSTVFIALIIALLHGIAFLSTLIMSKVDVLISVRGGESVSTATAIWVAALLESNNFQSQLSEWRTLDQVRLVTSLLGWAGACYLSFRSVTAVEAKNTEIFRLREALFEWQKRVGELEGNEGLENLNTSALKRLITLQQIGLERAQNVLNTMNMQKKNIQ